MANNGATTAKRSKHGVLALLTGASLGYYMGNSAVIGYIAVYLYSCGYSEAEVGMITALNSAFSIFAAPLWGMLADRWRSTIRALLLSGCIGSVLYASVPLISGVEAVGSSAVLVLVPLALFFRNPSGSLLDNLCLRASDRHKLNYGIMRGAGSLAFAIGSITLGIIVPKTGPWITFYLASVLTVPAMVLAVLGGRDSDADRGEPIALKDMHFGELFANRKLISYLILSSIMMILLFCNSTFMPKLLEDINVDGARVGLVNGSKAFVEVPFIALLPVLRKRFKLEHILVTAGVMFACQALLYTVVGSFSQIVAVTLVLDGVGAGLFYSASSVYIFSLAPERLKATAQTLSGAMSSLSGVMGNLLGGFLCDNYGVRIYYLVVGILVMSAAILLALTRRDRKAAR